MQNIVPYARRTAPAKLAAFVVQKIRGSTIDVLVDCFGTAWIIHYRQCQDVNPQQPLAYACFDGVRFDDHI